MVDISPLTLDDIEATQALLAELGYSEDEVTVKARMSSVLNHKDHLALMACIDGEAVGLVHAFIRRALEKPLEACIQSMVVTSQARKQGIGQALMQAVVEWAREKDLPSISLHTQVDRDDALAFYTANGFEEVTQSRLLRRRL